MKCVRSEFDPRTHVCLVAKNTPLDGSEAKRLPLLAIKVSTGGVLKHGGVEGVKHYLNAPWKDGWSDWLRQAKEAFPSVLEHAVFTFYIDGCSRVCSHQLVRHRLVSFTQESQRYTEERIWMALAKANDAELAEAANNKDWKVVALKLSEFVDSYVANIEPVYTIIEQLFVIPPKSSKASVMLSFARSLKDYAFCRARDGTMEDCRYLLPQAVRTSLLATTNLREWLHIIELRAHPKAQWEIRGVANAIANLLKEEVKEVFVDGSSTESFEEKVKEAIKKELAECIGKDEFTVQDLMKAAEEERCPFMTMNNGHIYFFTGLAERIRKKTGILINATDIARVIPKAKYTRFKGRIRSVMIDPNSLAKWLFS